jgi:hypothetical protein
MAMEIDADLDSDEFWGIESESEGSGEGSGQEISSEEIPEQVFYRNLCYHRGGFL